MKIDIAKSVQLPWLTTNVLGRPCLFIESVESTQDALKELLEKRLVGPGAVLMSQTQTRGRGRQGRSWISMSQGLFVSMAIDGSSHRDNLPFISILAGLSLARTLEQEGCASVTLKWPNDVFIGERKVAGILAELISLKTLPIVLLGLGVNIVGRGDMLPTSIRQTATTLEECGIQTTRESILTRFLNELESMLLDVGVDVNPWVQEFNQRWVYQNREVTVSLPEKTLNGLSKGIDSTGALLLQTSEGIERIISGDVIHLRSPAKS